MSKSRGNVVNPDGIIARYGTDAFRLFEMFLGPLEHAKPWNTRGVEGTSRFLNRAWRLIAGDDETERGTTSVGSAVRRRGQAPVPDPVPRPRPSSCACCIRRSRR